ncbi:unnamed protein product [Lupinus luteus]|uniref:Uncharacterized protein n=1 Tax=Lupinus luteus TaxID=3873 RepID=A0AAV1YGQ9_LUPLU
MIRMDFRRSSTLKLTILLVFFIIASDMCKKSDAKGPVITLPCQNDQQCRSFPRCNECGCKCIVGIGCQCSTSLNNNIHTQSSSTMKL